MTVDAAIASPLVARPGTRDRSDLERTAHKSAAKAARLERFRELTEMRQRYLEMRGTRNLSGVQLWLPQDRNQFHRRGLGQLGAAGPDSTRAMQDEMTALDQIEEQVYSELAFATSQGADVGEANARYDVALSKLVDLETSIDRVTDADAAEWTAAAEDTRTYLNGLLVYLRELNRETTSGEQKAGLWLGLGTAAAVVAISAFLWTRGARRRRR